MEFSFECIDHFPGLRCLHMRLEQNLFFAPGDLFMHRKRMNGGSMAADRQAGKPRYLFLFKQPVNDAVLNRSRDDDRQLPVLSY